MNWRSRRRRLVGECRLTPKVHGPAAALFPAGALLSGTYSRYS